MFLAVKEVLNLLDPSFVREVNGFHVYRSHRFKPLVNLTKALEDVISEKEKKFR